MLLANEREASSSVEDRSCRRIAAACGTSAARYNQHLSEPPYSQRYINVKSFAQKTNMQPASHPRIGPRNQVRSRTTASIGR